MTCLTGLVFTATDTLTDFAGPADLTGGAASALEPALLFLPVLSAVTTDLPTTALTGSLIKGLAEDWFGLGLPFTVAVLAGVLAVLLTAVLIADLAVVTPTGLAGDFFAANGLPVLLSTDLPTALLTFFATGLGAAFVGAAFALGTGLAVFFAGVAVFFAAAFTVCLLWGADYGPSGHQALSGH